jgi:CHAT domain-containing protein/tetratricopeptide (TPR) repeat protein
MALRNTGWARLCRIVSAATLVIMVAAPAAARTPKASASKQWQLLNAQVIEAYRAGDLNGIALAESALRLARQAFGARDPKTLASLNNLALLFKVQGRYGEAETLYGQVLQARLEVLGPRHPDTLTSVNNLAGLYLAQGRYDAAEPLYRKTLQARLEVLGPRHPDTLGSFNNLAFLYQAQGRNAESEQLNREALRASREVLGPRHQGTLTIFNNLALAIHNQGRYSEAEFLYREALQLRREVLGAQHPDTLVSLGSLALVHTDQGRYAEAEAEYRELMQANTEVHGREHPETLTGLNNLAQLYGHQGRYGEAEQLYRKVLQTCRQVLGPRHPNTLTTLSNLALLYKVQGRYGEAEPMYGEVLQARVEVLGPRHPDTLISLGSLAIAYQDAGRYDEAEPLSRQALQMMREVFGPHHKETLRSLNNLAYLYDAQGRYGEAEPLYRELLQASREVLGPRHSETLYSLNNLAALYLSQARYGEAEPLLREALQASGDALGSRHPYTLLIRSHAVVLLVNQGKREEAVSILQQMESDLLGWVAQEFYSTEAGAVRRQLVSSRSSFQDLVLTLATEENNGNIRRLAGSSMLRFKLLQGEEETYLLSLSRRSQDWRVRTLAKEVSTLRAMLGRAVWAARTEFNQALQALEAKQLELGTISRGYSDILRVQTASLDDLRAVLPAGAVLVEFRQFWPIDFRTGVSGEPHFAGLLLRGPDEPMVADLGLVSDMHEPTTALTDEAAATLYRQLFAPFEQKIAAATSVYVAPDGILNLVPFAQLKLADGRYWAERQEVRLLQSGRDLLRADPDKPTRGLLALGGIDFGAVTSEVDKPTSVFLAAGFDLSGAVTRTAGTFREGFKPLVASRDEAIQVKALYQLLRKDEPAEVWLGPDASKARLMALASPPRVLHLATHGFYFADEARDPMLHSGVALAGANRAVVDSGKGMLFALEAQGLNLEGSELVVLSACNTAQGNLDYSEGVYGLVRALRLAGARNVLVTLWPVNDGEARDFMVAFYKTWLNQIGSDPAKALRDTQLSYLKQDKLRDSRVWAPYILIE